VLLVAAAHREPSPGYTQMRDCGALRDHYDVDELRGPRWGMTMKTGRVVKFAVVLLAAGVGLTASLGARPSAAGTAPAVSASADLYVDWHAQCVGADGSQWAPFCTISAAAAVVSPGQTVNVEPGTYNEAITFTRSGTSSAPITFVAANTNLGGVDVGGITQTVSGSIFNLSNVHDVVIRGFTAFDAANVPVVLVENSARITLDDGGVHANFGAGVQVTGASSDVTISRTHLAAPRAAGIQIDAGVARAQLSENTFVTGGLAITDAPGTTVSGNTFVTNCRAGITVAGTSPGVSIQNNIVETARNAPDATSACASPGAATAITVSTASIPQTVADYNLIDPASTAALYTWGGLSYPDLPSFRAATGQGGHDIAANPGLVSLSGADRAYYPISATSPAVDSANADAPGELTTDLADNARADDPDVANTGTGTGYYDRGAAELEGADSGASITIGHTAGGAAFDVTVTVTDSSAWVTNGPVGQVVYNLAPFGVDEVRYPVITSVRSLQHTFHKAGSHCVRFFLSYDGFRTAPGEGDTGICTVLGAYYTPVTPTRILDTRTTTGVSSPAPIPPNSDLTLPLPAIGSVPAGDVTAVVLNVTVTAPTAPGYLTVYPAGTTMPSASNLNFIPGQTVPNLVTVPVVNGSIAFHNGSPGTVHVVADLAGFYGAGGSGFKAQSPVRVMDTRDGTGTGTARPIGPGSILQLDLSNRVPAGATAVILNTTVTAPTAPGFLTVYPDGVTLPSASNLNFTAGQTVPNLVMVPVHAGKVDFYNAASGTVHVVADLAGYFGSAASGATQVFVPDGPLRLIDTRDGTGIGSPGAIPMPVGPGAQLWVHPTWIHNVCVPDCPFPTADVLNVTVTAPTAPGYLTVYPSQETLPVASNLNFTPGQTVPNLVTVADDIAIVMFNGSPGSTHVVVDEEGYFINAPS